MYALLRQSQPYGDGMTYLHYLRREDFVSHHLLYIPDLWLFVKAIGLLGVGDRTAAFLFSGFCAALGNALLVVLLMTSRGLLPERLDERGARIWAAFAVGAPSLMFFATQIENHAHHYLWAVVLLLAVDRALVRESIASWLLAGFALVAAYSSHSSILLAVPALCLAIQVVRRRGSRDDPSAARSSRSWLHTLLPRGRDWLFFALLAAPVVVFRLLEGSIRVDLLGGAEHWRQNRSLEFLRSLLELRSVGTWIEYIAFELLLPMIGVVFALLVLAFASSRSERGRGRVALGLLGIAVLPYLLIFGHWPVREFGAYYIAILPAAVLVAAYLAPKPSVGWVALVVLQALFAGGQSTNWVANAEALGQRDPSAAPAWVWTADAAKLSGKTGTIVVWPGLRHLHLEHDHAIESLALENWMLFMRSAAAGAPDPNAAWQATAKNVVQMHRDWLARGPVLWSKRAMDEVSRGGPSAIGAALRREFRLVDVQAGSFRGVRVERR